MVDVPEIQNLTFHIKQYTTCRFVTESPHFCRDRELKDLCDCLAVAFSCWARKFFVGIPKKQDIEDAFQNFFVSLEEMLKCFIANKDALSDFEVHFLESVIYQGAAYRYLGVSNENEEGRIIKPRYDNIFVSWSKNLDIPTVYSDLLFPRTLLACEILDDRFAIDVEGFNKLYHQLKGRRVVPSVLAEQEVVFPTDEKCIKCVKYENEENFNLN